MSKMSQKEAVFSAVTSVLSENGISFTENSDIGAVMTSELRSQVNQILFEGFKAESIELSKTLTDTKLKSYTSGLQSNWLRKDKRLNGGIAYKAKNPGSRAGGSDPQLKAMRALLGSLTVETEREEVQTYIDARVKEIAATRATKSVVIDTSALPESLRGLVK